RGGRGRAGGAGSPSASSDAAPAPATAGDSGAQHPARGSPHAAAAAAVAEPVEKARENSRPRAAGVFHLEGSFGYARRRRGQARSPDRGGNGARGRRIHSHPLAPPGRKMTEPRDTPPSTLGFATRPNLGL